MDKSQIATALIGAVIIILSATGICSTEEGTSLGGYAGNVALGIIGIVDVVKGIVKRKKAPAQVEDAKPEEK